MQTASKYQRFLVCVNYANLKNPIWKTGELILAENEEKAIDSVLWWKGEYTDQGLGERTIKVTKVNNEGEPI